MKIQNPIVSILLFALIISIGITTYYRYQYEGEQRKYLDERFAEQDSIIINLRLDVKELDEKLGTIRDKYPVIEKKRNKKNDEIKKLNDADSIANEFNNFWSGKSRE